MENTSFAINESKRRFELEMDGKVAIIDFQLRDNEMTLTHTKVPDELEGQGVGKKLVEHTLEFIKDHNYTLVPLCPFVTVYIKRHPEWKDLLADGYSIN
ncbi:MAG TPA: GNAT family N-acetyltransferase [Flavobacterium sp.]|jgi:hypothetical protein